MPSTYFQIPVSSVSRRCIAFLRHALPAFVTVLMAVFVAAGIAEAAPLAAAGPDMQPAPADVERYTDIFSIIAWGVFFGILSVVLPFLGFFVVVGAGGAIIAGGAAYEFSEQVRLRQPLNPLAAFFHGVATLLFTIAMFLFAGPLGFYHWTLKPLLLRMDDADATVCCLPYNLTNDQIMLSGDGRWLFAFNSGSSPWFGSERDAAGKVFLIDTLAGGFVRFPDRTGNIDPYWNPGEGVKKVGFLRDARFRGNGRYVEGVYKDRKDNEVRERFDLQSLGMQPIDMTRTLPNVPESFRLTSYVNSVAHFSSPRRQISLALDGDSLSLDPSGTVAAVRKYEEESNLDRGTITFWYLPTGEKIRSYEVNYLANPNVESLDRTFMTAYGGSVWVLVIAEHVKVFRPLDGWTPSGGLEASSLRKGQPVRRG